MKILFYLPVVTPWWFDNIVVHLIRASLRGMANPYGDGCAAQRIVEVLTTVELGEKLLVKQA